MITINNVKFAKNENELIESLLTNKAASGFYKRLKRRIKLFDINNNMIGVVANNCLIKATPQENGKHWYNFGTIELIGEYKSYITGQDEIRTLATGRSEGGAYLYN